MAGVESRGFDAPDETRTPNKTKVDVLRIAGATAARLTLEPGWTWGECIKPVVGTETCELRHVGLAHSGAMGVAHDDGSEQEIRAGQFYVIEPGHTAWVVGEEPFIGFEFEAPTAEFFANG
ncbi:MAG: cupin domain-containing protein [Gaiellales bacterium]